MVNLFRKFDGVTIQMTEERFKSVGRIWLKNGWIVLKELPKEKEVIEKTKPKPKPVKARKKRVSKK